jgi:CRISPR-associated protein Cmr2
MRLLQEAGFEGPRDSHAHRQMRQQLEGFPEVHWAAVPFSLIQPRNAEKQTDLDTSALGAAMAPFFGVNSRAALRLPDLRLGGAAEERALGGQHRPSSTPTPARSTRRCTTWPSAHWPPPRRCGHSSSSRRQGWRCSLTGETEWLTTDPAICSCRLGQRKDTLWTRIAASAFAWAKKGEHLGALPALKRLWPQLFAEEVGKRVGDAEAGRSARRFVVSTHTMSLAHQLDQWLERGAITPAGPGPRPGCRKHGGETVALPRRLMRKHGRQAGALDDARRLPACWMRPTNWTTSPPRAILQGLVRRTLATGAMQAGWRPTTRCC